MAPSFRRLWLVWVIWMILLLGVGTWFMGRVSWAAGDDPVVLADWPRTTGTILVSEVIEAVSPRPLASLPRKPSEPLAPLVTNLEPRIQYRYVVAGVGYTNQEITRVRRLGWQTPEAFARAMTNRFPVGAEVPVHYDPQVPGRSVLLIRYDAGGTRVMPLLFGGAFLLFIVLVAWPRRRRSL